MNLMVYTRLMTILFREVIYLITLRKTLIKLDLESLEYIPLLVKKILEGSDDNLSFTYEIKDGIKWDDGTIYGGCSFFL